MDEETPRTANRRDPRGELAGIEEELREWPVFSDRYWELKPRRRRLQARVGDPDRVGSGPPIFRHGLPNGCREQWRLIREYTERWHGIRLGDVGRRQREIGKVEARLGRELPPSMREWVAYAHDVRREPGFFDVLRDIYQMKRLREFDAVSLLLQCEGDYHWAVLESDFSQEDPPVQGYYLDYETVDDDDEFAFVPMEENPVAESVTLFALDYAISYTHGKGGGFGTEVADAVPLLRDLQQAFPVHCRVGKRELFEKDAILVSVAPTYAGDGQYLSVELREPLDREAIPAFLWDYTNGGGCFHGLFLPDR